jgi:hypothetical protein
MISVAHGSAYRISKVEQENNSAAGARNNGTN